MLSHRPGTTTLEYFPILHEPGIVGDLIVENPRLRIAGLRQPVHAAGAGFLRLRIDRFDQGPAKAEPARGVADEQVLQIAVIADVQLER